MQIAVLIDDSAAATDAMSFLRDGLAAFLERMRGHAEIALITTGERPTVLTQYTTDNEVLTTRRSDSSRGRLRCLSARRAGRRQQGHGEARGHAPGDRRHHVRDGAEYSNLHYQNVLKQLAEERRRAARARHRHAVGSLDDEMRNRGQVLSEGTSRTGGRRDQVLANSGIPDKLSRSPTSSLNQYVVTYGRPDKLIPPEKIAVTVEPAERDRAGAHPRGAVTR